MSDSDRSQYAEEVTSFSENELQRLLEIVEPPICLLGGWAVHVHATDAFRAERGRGYIGSRDIDLGVHVDPSWNEETLQEKPVAATIVNIESELSYNRGRFGFYRYFNRETTEALDDDEAANYPQHEIFRVDVDVLPSTRDLDAFASAFGFRPPAEPLLKPAFTDDHSEPLDDFVAWKCPAHVRLASRPLLAAMKVRALPERDKSHKRLKDVADLHAPSWYGSDFDRLGSQVTSHLTQRDVHRFADTTTEELFERAARLIGVDVDIVGNSIERLLR